MNEIQEIVFLPPRSSLIACLLFQLFAECGLNSGRVFVCRFLASRFFWADLDFFFFPFILGSELDKSTFTDAFYSFKTVNCDGLPITSCTVVESALWETKVRSFTGSFKVCT